MNYINKLIYKTQNKGNRKANKILSQKTKSWKILTMKSQTTP